MEELVTCEGTVHSIIFQNAENGYTVLRLLTEEGEVITVVGCIPCVAPGEHLAVSGVPETHPQHGEQLRAVELERSLPEDEEEIFSYLSSGICKGVGPATARRIVERFGAETLDVLEREPERLTTLKGVTARKAQEIAESFRRHMGLRRLMAFVTLLAVIAAGVYLTMTMLFRINSIQVQTPDGKQVTEIAGYSADSILQRMGVQLEENIFSFEPGEKAAVLEQNFPLLGSIKVIRDYPNTVVVQVTEAVPAYAVQNGNKWLVISDKWKILSEESTQPEGLCTLYGGKLQDTTPGQGFWFVDDADAASASGSETAESESAVSTETARMEALRTLRSKLEEYGLSQDVTRLEVADTEQLAFLYQDRISVLLGTLNDLDYKLDRARYVLTNADGKGCGPTDTGRLDFSHTSASSTRKIYFAQGEPTLPSGYVVPPKAEEPAPAEDAADSTDSTESADAADTTEPAADADTEQLPLTHPDRMTANEEENPM